MLKNLRVQQQNPTTILVDNMSFLALGANLIFHTLTKHIEGQLYYVREYIKRCEV